MEDLERVEIIEVEYQRPKFWRRVVANLFDLILTFFVFMTLFVSIKEIVNSTSSYKKMKSTIDTLNLESGLYVKDSDRAIVTITNYITNDKGYTWQYKTHKWVVKVIDNFIGYVGTFDAEYSKVVQEDYDKARLETKGNDSASHPYFIKNEEGEIVINTSQSGTQYYADKVIFEQFYEPYIKNTLSVYQIKYVPNYGAYTRTMNRLTILLEIPLSLFLSILLMYYIVPLILRRGRQTIGNKSLQIGFVDQHYLSPSLGRFTVKFLLFLLEITFSIFSFGLPFLISITMMATTKNKQGFSDYMTGLQAVDTNKQKIFFDKTEVLISKAKTNKSPIDFNLPNNV